MVLNESENNPEEKQADEKPGKEKKKLGPVKILLVEDNPRVRRVMEILLIKRGFEVYTANDGQAGVQAALAKEPTLLLLDIQLPKMNGYDVLKTLRSRKRTRNVPVLMTTAAHRDRDSIIKAVKLGANDFIIQPVPESLLFERIEKVLKKIGRPMPVVKKKEATRAVPKHQELLNDIKDKPINEKIDYIIDKSDTLVALPFVISKVLKITRDESAGAKQLAWAVSSDTAITAVVLRRANSAYYGKREKIADVSEAIIRMGFTETRNLVLGLSFMKFLSSKGRQSGMNPIEFWKHSLAVAAFSRMLASAARMPQLEVAFTAGLLHDLGKVILGEYLPEEYTELYDECRRNNGIIRQVEEEKLTSTHANIGYRLASKWQLPEDIYNAIRFHHQPNRPNLPPLARIVHIADALAKAHAIGEAGDMYLEDTPNDAWKDINIPKGIDSGFTKKVFGEILQAKDFLDISDDELKDVLKPAAYKGDLLFADFTGSIEQIPRVFVAHMGYRTRNVSEHDKLTRRLKDQQWAIMMVMLRNKKDIEFVKSLEDDPEIKKPGNTICFHPKELEEEIKTSGLSCHCFGMPCNSADVIGAIGVK